ncbi:MAG: hypothetical protein NVS2B6_17230 [Thermoleophilaceae bacterium]
MKKRGYQIGQLRGAFAAGLKKGLAGVSREDVNGWAALADKILVELSTQDTFVLRMATDMADRMSPDEKKELLRETQERLRRKHGLLP